MFNLFKSSSSGQPKTNMSDKTDKTNKDRTTRTIALVLLYTFISSVVILFLVNIFIKAIIKEDTTGDDFQKGWFDLLKNALVLLGTALTTIIGYYFGQREGTIKAEQAEKKVEETDQRAQKAVKKAFQERDEAFKSTIGKESDPLIKDTTSVEEKD